MFGVALEERYAGAAIAAARSLVELRQLGLLYYQERETDRARAAFARYLAAVPDAPDAARVREYLAIVGESRP